MIISVQYKNIWPQQFYTEGPVIDSAGNIYFTTLAGGKIKKLAHDNTSCDWADLTCPNGQTITPDHTHICCDSRQAALVEFDKDGSFIGKIIDTRCAGQTINVPNDVITDKNGNIYFTDSIRYEGKVGFISNSGHEKILAARLDYPNGLALSPDETILYVAESYKNRIIAFDLTKEGFRVFANLPEHPSGLITRNLPDGIKTDHYGNLWVAHYGMGKVHVLSPHGHIIQSIEMLFDLPSNIYLKNTRLIVTGGYAEPGPGCVVEMEVIHG